MKRSDLKELIKKSMHEVAPKGTSGAMTPEEEAMVKYALDNEKPMEEDILREADEIVAAYAENKTVKEEVNLQQANFSDLHQVIKNIAHINGMGMKSAAMDAIEYIAEQFDVPVDFHDF